MDSENLQNLSNLRNFDYKKIVQKIKDLLNNAEFHMDSFTIKFINEINFHEDKEKIIIDIIDYCWSLEKLISDYFLYSFINISSYMSLSASNNILNIIKKLLSQDKLLQYRLIEIIPILVSNIRRFNDDFTGFINIVEINCHNDNLVYIVKIMREMNTLKSNEKSILIKRLLSILCVVDLSQCPELVREILLLCDKINFQYCIGSIIDFFDHTPVSSSQLSQSTINSDNKRMIEIQMSVLNYCNDIAKTDGDFVKEIIKFCKNNNPVFSLSGFMCIILMNLSGLEHAKDLILEFLKSCIMKCFKDNKIILESAFIRESFKDHLDIQSLLLHVVKYCCVSRGNLISSSLINLGFLLIKSGLPKSKIVTLIKPSIKSKQNEDCCLIGEMSNNDFNMTTLQKMGEAGVKMLLYLFKRLEDYRKLILDNILGFILKESHRPSVFIYLELFSDLISMMPVEINSSLNTFDSQPLFDLLCHFPHDVALSIVHSLLPLLRHSINTRARLLSVIMNNMLSAQQHCRNISIASSLIILKYLPAVNNNNNDDDEDNDMLSQQQSSQFYSTQIFLEYVRPLSVDNSFNNDICKDILAMIDRACNQYKDTRSIIYKGLVKVAERNCHFSRQIVLFLLTKLETLLNESGQFVINGIVDEPIGVLVSCLAESVRICNENKDEVNILTATEDIDQDISNAVNKSETLLTNLLTSLSNLNDTNNTNNNIDDTLDNTEQLIDVYEALLAHFICNNNNSNNKELVKKIFDNRQQSITLMNNKKRKQQSNTAVGGVVMSLSILSRCLQYLLEPLQEEIINNNINNNDGGDDNNVLYLNETISTCFLNRTISLVKNIGTADWRITSRNRENICLQLSQTIMFSLDYYIVCLSQSTNNNKSVTLTTPQRQLMNNCITLYCTSLNKIIQFFSKTINIFLNNCFAKMRQHLNTLQINNNNTNNIDNNNNNESMTIFIDLNKSIISTILQSSQKRLFIDIDFLLNTILNISIFCGINNNNNIVVVNSIINTSILNKFYQWLIDLLTSSSVVIDNHHVCRVLLSMTLCVSRMVRPDFICFIDKLASEINIKMDSYCLPQQHNNNKDNDSKMIIKDCNTARGIVKDVINGLKISLDDTDWLLMKWSCGWLEIKQKRAINNSQLSNLCCTPAELLESSLNIVIDQDRILIEQLQTVCLSINKLLQCSINSVLRLQELVKITTRLFDQLTMLTKQYIQLTKSKLGSCSSEFKKLVYLSGGDLSNQVSLFIVYIQKVESASRKLNKENVDDKKADVDDCEALFDEEVDDEDKKSRKKKEKTNDNNLIGQLGRTDKEIKLIPNLVFALEQYQRFLMELQKVSKIDLMKYVKIVNSRDFRIDVTKLKESLDQNVSIDLSEISEDNEDNRVAAMAEDEDEDVQEYVTGGTAPSAVSPPTKKLRLPHSYASSPSAV